MSIWYRPFTLEDLNRQSRGCMVELIDIRFSEIGPDYLRATMPVDARTWQPFGLLHGGASVVLAETLGSVGANCCVDPARLLLRRPGDQRQPPARRAQRPRDRHRPARSTSAAARRSGRSASRTSASGSTAISRMTLAVVEGQPPALGGGGALVNGRLLVPLLALATSLAGCGLKGSLYLPEKSREVIIRPAPGTPAEAPTPAEPAPATEPATGTDAEPRAPADPQAPPPGTDHG